MTTEIVYIRLRCCQSLFSTRQFARCKAMPGRPESQLAS